VPVKVVFAIEGLEQDMRAALAEADIDRLRTILGQQHPADIADVIDRLDDDDKITVFELLDPQQAADVLADTGVDSTRELIKHLGDVRVAEIFRLMATDDVVEILGEDFPEYRERMLAAMEPTEAREALDRLSFPPRTAGRLMSEHFVRARASMSAAEGLQLLRQVAPRVETLTNIYVLDAEGRFEGVVTLQNLLIAAPERRLGEIAVRDVVTVTPLTDQEHVAQLVSQYDLYAIAVLDDERRLLGIVTVDDVIDVLIEESAENLLRLGAVQVGPTDESYFDIPILRQIRRRIGWLLILFITGTMTVSVLNVFEDALAQVVVLSFFIPLLIGTGGNTGAQTVSTMVRGIAVGEIRGRDIWRVVAREFTSGLILGFLLGTVAFGLALLLGNAVDLGLVVGLAIVAICTWANTMGAVVPIVAQKIGLDPALVSAPLITTLVDASGLAIYLLIAKAILGI
jgi:magnesium transporter